MTRYGLVVVFAWIGAIKFSAYEASGIQPLVANSPLMSWLYSILSVQASNWLGVLEIAIAVMIPARPVSAKISAAGSALAAVLILGTLSFTCLTTCVGGKLRSLPACPSRQDNSSGKNQHCWEHRSGRSAKPLAGRSSESR